MELSAETTTTKINIENVTSTADNSDEQLLGSLTTYNSTEGSEIKSQQIRSSARVFKKMKLDLTPTLLVAEKREKKEDIKQDNKKCYRPLWTSDDKTIFFEALNEYGKDFESLQTYISAKMRKRGVPDNLIKTKDQIRHLYYRTWQKVCKHVKFADGVKKIVQELYGLINYGELRKKIGPVREKTSMKLNELIYTGSVMMRIKGKNVRVKTPMCRALRRLNQLDEKYDEIKLPTRVVVELRPKDMASYLKVQIMAQNPRIKTTLTLQRRLSNLIACISKRWKTVDAVMYDKSVLSSSTLTNDLVPPSKVIDENKRILNPLLRLSPPANCKIEIPSINLSEYFTRQSICLTAYENRVGIRSPDEIDNIKSQHKNSPKKAFRQRTDSISDKTEKQALRNGSQPTNTSLSDSKNVPQLTNISSTENESATIVNEVVNEAVNTILALQQSDIKSEEDNKPDSSTKATADNPTKLSPDIDKITDQKATQINNIRKGWTELDSNTLTIGEIYLMFGSDSKVILEYSWDDSIPSDSLIKNGSEDSRIPQTSDENDRSEDEYTTKNKDLSDSLAKLLSVAKLHYRKNIIKCPCGHVCNTKSNIQLKRAFRKILIDKCNGEPDDKIASEETIFDNGTPFTTPPVYIKSNIHQISPASFFHPPNTPMVHLITESIERLKPYCNRKGRRPRSKQVVVERKLPLLPNKMESGHQIVRMNIISQEDSSKLQTISETIEESSFSSVNASTSSQKVSSVFIEESLEGTSSILLDQSNDNANPVLLNDSTLSSVPSSPSRILKESDSQSWINSEVADYSLSSLLGHLESPMKSGQSNEDSHMSQDVDAQLHSLLTESSVDFSASFADLAAQVVNEIKK